MTLARPQRRYARHNSPAIPIVEPERTYSSLEMEKVSGATLRQLQWWDEHGVVKPRHVKHHREYSFAQAVFCCIVSAMRPTFSLQRLRKLFVAIKSDQIIGRNTAQPKIYLLVSDRHAIFAHSEIDVVEKMDSGRRFALISIHDIIARLRTLG